MRRTSALADSEEKVNTLLESLPSADDVFDRTTFEQCERVLNETLGDTGTSTSGNETTRYENTTTTTTKGDNGLEGVADIESAFDDLLA